MMTSDNEKTSIILYLKRNEKCLSPVQKISNNLYFTGGRNRRRAESGGHGIS